MELIRIEDPHHRSYPLPEALYDDARVVYHGTSSSFSHSIERDGFTIGRLPFSLESLQQLISICDQIRFRSWAYNCVLGLARGNELSRGSNRAVYFSANFWYSRDYATNGGGETVHN